MRCYHTASPSSEAVRSPCRSSKHVPCPCGWLNTPQPPQPRTTLVTLCIACTGSSSLGSPASLLVSLRTLIRSLAASAFSLALSLGLGWFVRRKHIPTEIHRHGLHDVLQFHMWVFALWYHTMPADAVMRCATATRPHSHTAIATHLCRGTLARGCI